MIYQILLAGLIYVSSGDRLLLQSSINCCYNGASCSSISGVASVCATTYNICTVGCDALGANTCSLAGNQIGVALTCQQSVCLPAAPGDVCNTPQATDPPVTGTTAIGAVDPTASTEVTVPDESTVAPFDLSCLTAADCAAKHADLTAGVGFLGEAFRCIQEECTITCSSATSCDTADSLINNQMGTAYDFVCDGSSDPVCVQRSSLPTTTDVDATDASTTEDEDGCNTDVCSAARTECNEDGPADACYVQFTLDADVCILNHGFRRRHIYDDFRWAVSTAIDATFTLDGVCDDSTVKVTGYACVEKANPMYVFDTTPTRDTCPANAATRCVKGNQAQFAASVGVELALFCGSGSCDDLDEIADGLKAAVAWAADFVEEARELSVSDDTICQKGFGLVTANDLAITVHNADGSVYETILDTTGGAVQGWFYMAGVVAVVMLAFL